MEFVPVSIKIDKKTIGKSVFNYVEFSVDVWECQSESQFPIDCFQRVHSRGREGLLTRLWQGLAQRVMVASTTVEFVKVQLRGEEIKEVPEEVGVSEAKVRFAQIFGIQQQIQGEATEF